MICTSCQRDAGGGPLCIACGAVQSFRSEATCFEILGVPATFFLDAATVEERFKELNRKLHPDRFAQRSAQERRLSIEWTTAVNGAYRTLKEPLRRAIYFVKTHGIDVERETGKSAQQRLPPELLEEALEQREALEEAKAAKDLPKVGALAKVADVRSAAVFAELQALLREFEETGQPDLLEQAGGKLAALKYFSRFQEEVEAIERAALE